MGFTICCIVTSYEFHGFNTLLLTFSNRNSEDSGSEYLRILEMQKQVKLTIMNDSLLY